MLALYLHWNSLDQQVMFQLKRRDPSDVEQDLLLKLMQDAYQMLTGMISVTAYLWASGNLSAQEKASPEEARAGTLLSIQP